MYSAPLPPPRPQPKPPANTEEDETQQSFTRNEVKGIMVGSFVLGVLITLLLYGLLSAIINLAKQALGRTE